jgi:hypothetical protein
VDTRVGAIDLANPKLREGSDLPGWSWNRVVAPSAS